MSTKKEEMKLKEELKRKAIHDINNSLMIFDLSEDAETRRKAIISIQEIADELAREVA